MINLKGYPINQQVFHAVVLMHLTFARHFHGDVSVNFDEMKPDVIPGLLQAVVTKGGEQAGTDGRTGMDAVSLLPGPGKT